MERDTNEDRFTISKANESALEDILLLLSNVNLPHDGVREHLSDFLIARDESGQLVGCVGMEPHGRLGLLRSAAVEPELQGAGLGSKLTSAVLEIAAKEGITEVVLLTTTAKDFFARKFGFIVIGEENPALAARGMNSPLRSLRA